MVNQTFLRTTTGDPANRHPHDFYITPEIATRALLEVEKFRGAVWEPACGDGSMSRVLEGTNKTLSSDLHDHGYGQTGIDFLTAPKRDSVANVVTNPPFKLAEEFARTALHVSTKKVALLCRLTWLEGSKRGTFFESSPLARVWIFSYRVAIHRATYKGPRSVTGKGGTVAYAWYVWEHGHEGPPDLGWLNEKKEK